MDRTGQISAQKTQLSIELLLPDEEKRINEFNICSITAGYCSQAPIFVQESDEAEETVVWVQGLLFVCLFVSQFRSIEEQTQIISNYRMAT